MNPLAQLFLCFPTTAPTRCHPKTKSRFTKQTHTKQTPQTCAEQSFPLQRWVGNGSTAWRSFWTVLVAPWVTSGCLLNILSAKAEICQCSRGGIPCRVLKSHLGLLRFLLKIAPTFFQAQFSQACNLETKVCVKYTFGKGRLRFSFPGWRARHWSAQPWARGLQLQTNETNTFPSRQKRKCRKAKKQVW